MPDIDAFFAPLVGIFVCPPHAPVLFSPLLLPLIPLCITGTSHLVPQASHTVHEAQIPQKAHPQMGRAFTTDQVLLPTCASPRSQITLSTSLKQRYFHPLFMRMMKHLALATSIEDKATYTNLQERWQIQYLHLAVYTRGSNNRHIGQWWQARQMLSPTMSEDQEQATRLCTW
jgi:hypothetical protein